MKHDVNLEDNVVSDDISIKNNSSESKFKAFVKSLIPYVVIFITVMLIRTFIVTPIVVSGPSMRPTLHGGEVMLLNKMTTEFNRFDVVVVDIGYEDIIKRIIAMPGESISCEKGKIYINGKIQEDIYGMGVTYDFDKVILSDDEYFVMGDNREDSKDSRMIGAVKRENIKGIAKFVLFPFNSFGNIE